MTYDQISHHRIHEIPGMDITKDQAVWLWTEFFDNVQTEDYLPVEGAQQAMQQLKSQGHTLYVLTGRREKYADRTHAWLDHYFSGIFEDVLFTNDVTDERVSKWVVGKQVWASLHVDDHYGYAQDMSQEHIKTLLMDRPWNASYELEDDLIHRIHAREELYDHI